MMLSGHIRRDLNSNHQRNDKESFSVSSSIPLSLASTTIQTPLKRQQTMMNHDHMPYRYTTVC